VLNVFGDAAVEALCGEVAKEFGVKVALYLFLTALLLIIEIMFQFAQFGESRRANRLGLFR